MTALRKVGPATGRRAEPRPDRRAEHARRLDRALAELAGERGADSRGRDAEDATDDTDGTEAAPRSGSALHVLARWGLRVRPPYYYGLLSAWLYYALLLVPATGAGLWLLVWRHDAVRLLAMLSTTLQIGLGLAFVAAVLCWVVARVRRLSRWDAL